MIIFLNLNVNAKKEKKIYIHNTKIEKIQIRKVYCNKRVLKVEQV